VIEAVATGWLPDHGRMLDLGCGRAEIAAWFAERGYQATAIDIAQGALDQAAAKHAGVFIEYIAMNLCTQTLPGRTFDFLIDRGCLHQLPPNLVTDYVRNLSAMAAPRAKMLLFMKAFRGRREFGDPVELSARNATISQIFDGYFEVERAEPTYLRPDDSADPLPGIAYWLSHSL
jgi:SAM-dependent methyltransferase